MQFVNASKNSLIMDSNKKINKANYIISFKENNNLFDDVMNCLFIPNKKLLKQTVKQYNIDKNLLIYGFGEGRYKIYRLEWCI
jgi:hypothetical protein